MDMTNSIPVALRPLFDKPEPGRLVTYDADNALWKAIQEHHSYLPEVREYSARLDNFLRTGDDGGTDRPFGPTKLANAKTAMVTTIIAAYGAFAKDGKRWLRAELDKAHARIAELEASNRALGAALARKNGG